MKHAFLIIAHNNFEHLARLIGTLDHPQVRFYVNVDAKVPLPGQLASMPTINPIEILHRRRVNWGDQSQVVTELELFAKAFEDEENEWFHLLSGNDFPLKPIDELLRFYEQAEGADCFMETEPIPPHLADRVELFHFRVRRPAERPGIISKLTDKFLALQVRVGIKRKPGAKGGYRYGSNWVDMRRNAVNCLLEKQKEILRSTKFTQCADEIYKQTALEDSGLRIVNDNLRYIDWSARKPSPKSLGPADFDAMMSSGKLFARKFDAEDSPLLREMILNAIGRGD